ncbi:MAG: DUF3368 domain-containing protein [Lewinellaceae bacterium]|nr:DUF3368 domain-containing protein [Lewinellaceae bacterium]
MIVVSDTSPLSSLYLIDQLPLLPAIFGKIIVPEKVWEELLILETDFGRDLSALKSASWLDVVPASDAAAVLRLQRFLDAGESEAIVLAKELHADYLLIDEMEGREAAAQEGLKTIGVLGVFIQAKSAGFIAEVRPLMEDLREKARFHIHSNLFETVLRQAGEL